MKTFTKISLIAVGLAAGSFYAFSADALPAADSAAPVNPAGPRAGHPRLRAMMQRRAAMRAHIAKRLGLTADQITQLKGARAETRTAIQAIRSDSTLTEEQKKAKARETLQATREKMLGTLTAEQQEKFGQMRERLRQFRRGPI